MPELPEVETLRQSLIPRVVNKTVAKVEIYNPVVIESQNPEEFTALKGALITEIKRRGKYLLFHITPQGKDSQPLVMTAHMRMTGKLLYDEETQPVRKHEHLKFIFSDNSQLAFEDVRRFGRLWLVEADRINTVSGLNSLALEPLDKAFTAEYLAGNFKHKQKSTIKGTLLDQHVVAGLGNIYVDEVLFAAKIHPQRKVSSISPEETADLVCHMKKILATAIQNRGTTFRDYVDANNEKGDMQNFLKVFQRQGEPCPRCQTPIEKIKVVGRSSFYCPNCQKLPQNNIT